MRGIRIGQTRCREGAADCSRVPCEHGPHPQCAGLPSFGTAGEMYPNFLELRDGRVLLTFTVRCGQTPLPPARGMYWCNDTKDGHGEPRELVSIAILNIVC